MVEALLQSRYAQFTFVVPDEAERYCVAAARMACAEDTRSGAAIFSNDSDLVAFNAGPLTQIIHLDGLAETQEEGKRVLRAFVTRPVASASAMGLPDLLELAYQMHKERSISCAQALSEVKNEKRSIDVLDYQEFSRTYQLRDEVEHLEVLRHDPNARRLLNDLDARVSELIQQTTRSTGSPRQEIHMFLPVLFEDAERSSSWNVGYMIRELTYTMLLRETAHSASTIYEFKRAGQGLGGSTISALGDDDLEERCRLVQDFLEQDVGCLQNFTNVERWKAIVTKTVVWHSLIEGRKIPETGLIVRELKGEPCRSWESVDLAGRYQAAFYSFRMLLQILRYLRRASGLASRIPVDEDTERPFHVIFRHLQSLPSIADFFMPRKGEGSLAQTVEEMIRRMMRSWRLLAPSNGDPGRDREETNDGTRQRLRKRKIAGEVKREERDKSRLTSNPYAALAID